MALPQEETDAADAAAIDLLVDAIEREPAASLRARLDLQCAATDAFDSKDVKLPPQNVAIIETMNSSLPDSVRTELLNAYPGCRHVLLKGSGDHPYLRQCDEFAMHIVLFLRQLHDNDNGSGNEAADN